MLDSTARFLKLFFNKGETICVSDCQGGYHSVSQEELLGDIRLVSPKEDKADRFIKEKDINLVAINPIKGWRRDENVQAYRTFMIECDDMPIEDQADYIKHMKFPYSYCCYSGGKSLHFAIVLDTDLPGESIYRHTYQWILNIMTEADQKTKNPTRSVRFPGVIRKDKGTEQKLLHMGERVTTEALTKWLNMYPHKAPRPMVRKYRASNPDVKNINNWAKSALSEGVHNQEGSRNQTWMALGCEMALNGFSLEDSVYYLQGYFEEQTDFREREWRTAVESGWNYADKVSN